MQSFDLAHELAHNWLAWAQEIPEACSAEQAEEIVAGLAPRLGIDGELPSLRTVRLWRAKDMLTKAGRQFTRRNILELLAITRLRAQGVSASAASERVLELTDDEVRYLAAGTEHAPTDESRGFATDTVQILAMGLLQQYRAVAEGAVVGATLVDGGSKLNTPLALRQAMARLGRLYFVDGLPDHAASVNNLITLCTHPLATWAPSAVTQLPEYADAVLVDPTYLVPSED